MDKLRLQTRNKEEEQALARGGKDPFVVVKNPSASKGGVAETSIKVCTECEEEFCSGTCKDFQYDSYQVCIQFLFSHEYTMWYNIQVCCHLKPLGKSNGFQSKKNKLQFLTFFLFSQRLIIEEQEKDPTAVDTQALTLGGAKKGKGRGGKAGRGGRGGGRGGKRKRGGPGNLTRMPVNF